MNSRTEIERKGKLSACIELSNNNSIKKTSEGYWIPPDQVVKLTRGAGYITRWSRRDCGFESRECAVRKKMILTRCFHIISHVDTFLRELVFRIAREILYFHCSAQVRNRRKADEKKRVEISFRLRGLANSVGTQRPLRVQSPIGRATGREKTCCQLSSGVATCCKHCSGKAS